MAPNFDTLPDYTITEILYEGSRTCVYLGRRNRDEVAVAIKCLTNPYPSFAELVQFRNQYAIAKNLNIPGVIRSVSLEPLGNGYALVMEHTGDISLQQWLAQSAVERLRSTVYVIEVLAIAVQLTEILHNLHHARIIHKDIKPANILIHPESKQVKLIDFSIASLLPKETQEIQNPNVLEGTLAYLAPEQTGRMNRGIDYRADFYSLGVTLYELLTGVLPFRVEEPMALVHCHIAKQPTPPHQLNTAIPERVSAIIQKLMAKNAEGRYQSGLGLKHDLELCLHQLKATKTILPFELGQQDVSDRFLIPEKLYGREKEVKTLLTAFDRVAQDSSELMLVAGFSGIGKTAIVNEVHKPITRQNGYFIKGKFDQFNRNIPLSAFVQAFRDLMRQLLSESDTQLQTCKAQILKALGDNGQVMIEVIPELEQIIGAQPPAAELSGGAAQNRFNLLFQKFIQVFTTPEHPLVMFLDDLQWADSASLNLIQVLMAESTTGHLLLIGAYRDNEVSATHPLVLTLDTLKKAETTVNTITLQPLSQNSLNHLVADTLHCAGALAQPLTELVMQKTQGNPFFATQFLKTLHQEELVAFDTNAGCWQCDIVQVRDAALTDDVVEFMALQLKKLPADTQAILKLAACLGAQFDLQTLAIVSEQSQAEVATTLWRALQEGFILPQSEVYKFYLVDADVKRSELSEILNYKFLHDRVQQAAYSLITADKKQSTHLKIGQLLQESTRPETLESRILEIVGHFNLGIALLNQAAEKVELAKLNLLAGQKAKASFAHESSLAYFTIGIDLLTDGWEQQYDLTLELYEGAAESACLLGQFEPMNELIQTALRRSQTLLDRIKIHQIQIQGYAAQADVEKVMQTALTVLKKLDIVFPESPSPRDVEQYFEKVKVELAGKKIETLAELPQMSDPKSLAAMQILTTIIPVVFTSYTQLLPLVILTKVDLSIRLGNAIVSPFSYALYGSMLCGVVGDLTTGYQFGELAVDLLSRWDNKAAKSSALFIFNVLILHWKRPLKESIPSLQTVYVAGLESGDMEHAAWALVHKSANAYLSGQSLAQVEEDAALHHQLITQTHQIRSHYTHKIFHQIITNLRVGSKEPWHLTGEYYDETSMIPIHTEMNDHFALCYLYGNKLALNVMFDNYQQADEDGQKAQDYLSGAVSFPLFPLVIFYRLLVNCWKYAEASLIEQPKIWAELTEAQGQLQRWANHSPANYLHKIYIVEAEMKKAAGHKTDVLDLYDLAIDEAKANGFVQEEALANELVAKFYLNWGKEKIASLYMQEAYYCYARWGAKAKTDDLERRYPQLLQPVLQQASQSASLLNSLETIAPTTLPTTLSARSTNAINTVSTVSSSYSTSLNTALDFASVLRASQTMSDLIQLDELLPQLTQIMLQTSGGDRCLLALPDDDGTWQIRAIATTDTFDLCTESLVDNYNAPTQLIHYVKNTQETVVTGNLETELPIVDSYLNTRRPQSVLCLPILHHDNIVGVLYLHNQLTREAFTSDRRLVLNFLCRQAAISLENARLYQQVEHALKDLQQAQLKLVQSEKMSALGGLVAGVAHEINNPVGCITGNVGATQAYIRDLLGLLDLYAKETPYPSDELEEELETVDLEYVREDLPKLIRAMKDSGERIKSISRSLRTFSRADTENKQPFNLHEGLDSTLLILRHRLKANEFRPAIEVETDYSSMPELNCFPGQLNQVFMNILANAIDALDEASEHRSMADLKANPHRITVHTQLKGQQVEITIADNGPGMPASVRERIFDHLFTTKAVGKGTGLGLAIARQIIVESHEGTIEVTSELGRGTKFCILIPL